jgi:hypothetical protein
LAKFVAASIIYLALGTVFRVNPKFWLESKAELLREGEGDLRTNTGNCIVFVTHVNPYHRYAKGADKMTGVFVATLDTRNWPFEEIAKAEAAQAVFVKFTG